MSCCITKIKKVGPALLFQQGAHLARPEHFAHGFLLLTACEILMLNFDVDVYSFGNE
jgi:hypothetical protein